MDIEQLLKEGPSLTLHPEEEFGDLITEESKKEEVPEQKVYEEEKYLTDAEKKQVEEFAEQIEQRFRRHFAVWLRYPEKNVRFFRRNIE